MSVVIRLEWLSWQKIGWVLHSYHTLRCPSRYHVHWEQGSLKNVRSGICLALIHHHRLFLAITAAI